MIYCSEYSIINNNSNIVSFENEQTSFFKFFLSFILKEEEMSIDQLEEYINKLNSEAEILRDKHNALSERVRTLPLGQVFFYFFNFFYCFCCLFTTRSL